MAVNTMNPSQAQSTIRQAFDNFEKLVTADDARMFESTTIEDVRAAALRIEDQLASRQSLRNMKRLEPFFQGLHRYAKVMDVLCNGTPYLPWIWVCKDGHVDQSRHIRAKIS